MKNNSTDNIDIAAPKTPTTPVIHILIVEDNPAISKYLTNLLRRKGYKCILAFDASEAMVQYQAYQIPLILLDLEIPGNHGVNIANQMKNLKKQSSTIIIAFSKYHRDAMQFFALSNGIDAYIRDYRNQEDVIALITSNIPIASFSRQATSNSESFGLEPVTLPVLAQDNLTFKSFKCNIL